MAEKGPELKENDKDLKISERELGDLMAVQQQFKNIREWLIKVIRPTNKELPFLLQRKSDLSDYQTKIQQAKERAKMTQIQLLNEKTKSSGNFNILLPERKEIISMLNTSMARYKDIDGFKNLLHSMDAAIRGSDFHIGEWLEKIDAATEALSKLIDKAIIVN